MECNKLYESIKEKFTEFETNHLEFAAEENKAAAKRARLAINEIKKLVTSYKKASMEDCKNNKQRGIKSFIDNKAMEIRRD